MADWGGAIKLNRTGKPRFICAGDTALNDKNPLRTGQAIESAHVFCRVGSGSVRCHSRESKHGFVLDRRSYRFF